MYLAGSIQHFVLRTHHIVACGRPLIPERYATRKLHRSEEEIENIPQHTMFPVIVALGA